MRRKNHLLWAVLAALLLCAVVLEIILFLPVQSTEIDSQPTVTVAPTIANATNSPAPMPTAEQAQATTATEAPTPSAQPTGTEKPNPAFFCTLTIKGNNIEVYNSVDEASLDKRPGWLSSSTLPGADGMCVIYGHRNRRHFRVLEKIELGDEITVTMADGETFAYTVTDTIIYESTDELRLPTMDGASLVLVTCYPFHYTGHAPGKFVCVGKIA